MRYADKRTNARGSAPLAAWLAVMLWVAMSTGRANAFTPLETMTPSNQPLLHAVIFRFSSDQVPLGERRALQRLVAELDPGRTLLVIGYTDDIGPPAYNDNLALRRAEAVREVLATSGYERALIQVTGRGSSDYRASNESTEGRRQNRRVEIRYGDADLAQDGRLRGADPLRVGRYLSVAPAPSESQTDPLRTLIHVTFPRDIATVGAALAHLLARSGWRLGELAHADPAMGTLMALPLPETQRSLGPVYLIEAVKVLCGRSYAIVLDPVHRLVSCELLTRYTALRDAPEPNPGRQDGEDNPQEGKP